MVETVSLRAAAPSFISGFIFFGVVLAGCGYIVLSKKYGLSAEYVTLVPVAIMISYALLLGFARWFRLRDDQSGDNLYYMGFLFTLTSLGVSLYQYSSLGSAEQIVQNFGIAIASTITGIALRIFFNQMRRDPIEVEHFARLELAEASRKVKRELESTVLEFSYFRRSTQQSMTDSLEEVKSILGEAKTSFTGQLKDFAEHSSEPLERASQKSGDTIEEVSLRIAKVLDDISVRLTEQSRLIADSSGATVQALDAVVLKLKAMQTPDHVIEIKLNPTIQGLSRAVNNFTKSAETHAQTVADNIKETQNLKEAAADMLQQARTEAARAEAARAASADPSLTAAPEPAGAGEIIPPPPSSAPPAARPLRDLFSRFSAGGGSSSSTTGFPGKR